jgi:transposase
VCRTTNARQAPLKLAALVQEGLRRGLDGDPAYRGQLTKNPLHHDWEVIWGTDEPWRLVDLAVHLGDLMPKSLPKKRALHAGLGRNVALFDALRGWAYPRRCDYNDQQEWEEVALAVAVNINTEFDFPLSLTEVGHTSRSVARWTWRNIKLSLSQYQSAVGRRGGRAGQGEAKARRQILPQQVRIHTTEQLALFTREDALMPATYPERRIMTARQAAKDLGVSARTIQRHVAEPREAFLNRTRARAALAAELREQGLPWREVGDRLGISAGAAKEAVRRQQQKASSR